MKHSAWWRSAFNDLPLTAAEASMRLFGERVVPRL
jgi:hypothetical protein